MAIKDLNDTELIKNKNSLGLAKKQNQMMMNVQLNQPSVMGKPAGGSILSKNGQNALSNNLGSPLEGAKI